MTRYDGGRIVTLRTDSVRDEETTPLEQEMVGDGGFASNCGEETDRK